MKTILLLLPQASVNGGWSEEKLGKSNQRGWIVLRGKKWYGYFRRTAFDPTNNECKTDAIPVVLGLKSEMTKYQARKALEREITTQIGPDLGRRVMNEGSVTFGWFVRNRFVPLKEASWKEETAKVKKLIIQRGLIDQLEAIPLENFDKFTLQLHLNSLARTRSRDRVLQITAYLRDIFAEAVDQEFLVKDPARKLTLPAQLRESDRTTLTWVQLRQVLLSLPLRDRILMELDMTNALRPSELFAPRWKCFNRSQCTMHVMETAYKGRIRRGAKRRKALGVVHIPKKLAADLWLWKQQCPDSSPDAFTFPDKKGGVIDTGNYRKRILHKLARHLGLPKLTFQVIQRSIATLAQKKGTGEGRTGRVTTFANGDHYRHLHAGDS